MKREIRPEMKLAIKVPASIVTLRLFVQNLGKNIVKQSLRGAEQNILIFCVGDCFEIINH